MRTRRAQRTKPGRGPIDSDALAWVAFSDAVRAAQRSDTSAHVEALRRLTPRLDLAQRAGMFVWYALRYRTVAILGDSPLEEDIASITADAYRHVSALAHVDESRVRDTLLTAFGLIEPGRRVVRGDFVVIGTALLGALVDDVDAELKQMHEDMAEWYARRKAEASLD